jgi:hypothetical protein
MAETDDINALYREFTDALTDVFAENAAEIAHRGRLARGRAAVKKHPQYTETRYIAAVDEAFACWEAMQNLGRSALN